MLSFSIHWSVWLSVSHKLITAVVTFQRKEVYLPEFKNYWRTYLLKKMSSLLILPCCLQAVVASVNKIIFLPFQHFFFCLLCAWGVKWTGRVLFCCDFISVIVYYGRLPNSLSPVDYVIFFSHLINFICRTAKHSVIDYVLYFQK